MDVHVHVDVQSRRRQPLGGQPPGVAGRAEEISREGSHLFEERARL